MHLDSKSAPDPICKPCLAGKMHSNPFPSSQWRATRPLELVHSDVHQVPVETTQRKEWPDWGLNPGPSGTAPGALTTELPGLGYT